MNNFQLQLGQLITLRFSTFDRVTGCSATAPHVSFDVLPNSLAVVLNPNPLTKTDIPIALRSSSDGCLYEVLTSAGVMYLYDDWIVGSPRNR